MAATVMHQTRKMVLIPYEEYLTLKSSADAAVSTAQGAQKSQGRPKTARKTDVYKTQKQTIPSSDVKKERYTKRPAKRRLWYRVE